MSINFRQPPDVGTALLRAHGSSATVAAYLESAAGYLRVAGLYGDSDGSIERALAVVLSAIETLHRVSDDCAAPFRDMTPPAEPIDLSRDPVVHVYPPAPGMPRLGGA